MSALRGPAQAIGVQAGARPGLCSGSLGPPRQQDWPLPSSRRSQLRIHALSTSPLQSGCRQQHVLAPAPPSGLLQQQQPQPRRSVAARAIAGTLTATGIIPLGYDFLTFLTATVMVVPACKWLKISPVLGFLAAGIALEQAGMLKDLKDMETLSELGVLFLLYEQGLELSLDRLKALAKYAFGMGSLQVIITTLLFTAVALPAGSGLGTWFLEKVCHADPALVSIRTVDEAVVIAAALSMSSSAFVLQLLSERGESATRTGSATLGILLFQDIAIVPFLVLLPLIESNGGMEGASADTLLQMLGPTTATTLAGLGALLIGGRLVLRRVFEMVANSRSSEAFVAACLLTVGGSSLLTKQMGLSDTLGAFVAGVLLSETSFRTQVEADIRPFRGLLIGLFFLSVGGSINMEVLKDNYDVILWMLAGLVSLKAAVNTLLGPLFGLSKSESLRTGFLLSQGGEFAFVLLSLACQLKLLPEELNQILIITVVASMALTPALAALGAKLGDAVDALEASGSSIDEPVAPKSLEVDDPVVILGFGPQGQMVANMLASPLAACRRSYIGFDLEPPRVDAAAQAGFLVKYGDGSRSDVLKAAGVKRPAAVVVCHSIPELATDAVKSIRAAYSSVPIYACAQDFKHAAKLRDAGADQTCVVNSEAGLNLGSTLLADLGTPETDISLLRRGIHEALAVRTAASLPSKRSSGSGSIDAEAVHSALASIDSASSSSSGSGSGSADGKGIAHALSLGALMEGGGGSANGGAEGGSEQQKGKKPKKKEVEVFVLDGRMSYGLDTSMQSRPSSAAAADVVERPCSDCPLLQNGALLPPPPQQQQMAAALPTAASQLNGAAAGSVGSGAAEVHSNGSAPAAAAEVTVSATGSSPSGSPNSLGGR